jgi:transposase-like protein
LSYRHLEEMMQERGVDVDHSSINRWAVRFLPLLEKACGGQVISDSSISLVVAD